MDTQDPMVMAAPKSDGDDLADLSIMEDMDITGATASTSVIMTVVTTTGTTPSTTATMATPGMTVPTSATAGISGISGTPLRAHLLSCIESMTLNVNQPQYDWDAPNQQPTQRVQIFLEADELVVCFAWSKEFYDP